MTSLSDHPTRRWSLEIFRMSGARSQQRALEVFDRVGIPGVHVLGVVRPDGDFFLIVDAASIADCIRSRRIIASVDPSSMNVHSLAPANAPPPVAVQPQRDARHHVRARLRMVVPLDGDV